MSKIWSRVVRFCVDNYIEVWILRLVFLSLSIYLGYNTFTYLLKGIWIAPGVGLGFQWWQTFLAPVVFFTINPVWMLVLWFLSGVIVVLPFVRVSVFSSGGR